MTKGQPRAPTGTSNFVTKKEKANWDHLTTKIFCEVCAEEVHAGNRPNTHFNRVGWENVVNKFQRRTRRKYDQKQLKNKWESLKNQYKAWQQLIGSETGLGWDHNKGTVDADDAWWAEKEKVDPEVASFRHNGIDNLTEMEVMFSKTFATGDNSFNPYMVTETEDDEGYDASNDVFNDNMVGDESNVDLENIEVSNDLPLEKDHQHVKKRKETAENDRKSHITRKGKKSKVSTALVMQSQLDRICTVMESTVANSQTKDQSGYSISECITVLKKIPSIQPRSELFMLGTRLFVKREYREIFIALEEDDLRVNWLDEELKREKNHTPRR
ncbi:L10-interacting MYB domain-containing protein-like [Silene latifolia]|uniref:L10-interacting MYB domain-containing protein-like n=1 Tax=Silene latifolia TaxID=37657 RepID=UPI003D778071